MIEGQGIFQLAARSQAAASRYHADTLARRSRSNAEDGAASWADKRDNSAIRLTGAMQGDPKMKAFWEAAADKASDRLTISSDTLKRLDTASKSDNKEVAAEKYRQAKAKLQALRLQAQLAAATGDAKTLRRLAQEAAAAAREIANAARGLANGIAASVGTATSATPNVPVATSKAETPAGGADAGAEAAAAVHADIKAAGNDTAPDPARDAEAAYIGPVPADADPKVWGKEALRKLGDDARQAIAQARGIIAFLANAARARRNHQNDPEEERFFNELQRSVGDSEHDLDVTLRDASQAIDAAGDSSDDSEGAMVEVTTLDITVTTIAIQTTEVGASANFLV